MAPLAMAPLAMAVAALVFSQTVVAADALSQTRELNAPDEVVTAPAGTYHGFVANGTRIWRGIPYAEPPVGDRRWKVSERGAIYVDAQTGRQTDTQTGRQTDRQNGRQTDRQTGRQAGRQTDRQNGRQTDRQTARQAGRQAGWPHRGTEGQECVLEVVAI